MDKYIIYKHTSPSGGVYIGQTKHSIEHRSGITGSQYLAKSNGHYRQTAFAKAIIKYGWENFSHEILYKDLSKEEANLKEIELIAKYKAGGKCYNIAKGGEGNSNVGEKNYFYQNPTYAFLGHHHSEETKEILSKKRSKPILQFTLDGEFIKEWSSSLEAAEALGVDASNIRQVTCGNTKSAYGFQWKLKDSDKIIEPIKHPHNNGVLQYNKEGVFIKEWKSASEAARELNINRSGISNCCNGKSKSSSGFIWKYVE